jgi:hypothetical protein
MPVASGTLESRVRISRSSRFRLARHSAPRDSSRRANNGLGLLLRSELVLNYTAPSWLDIPAMVLIVISIPNSLQRLDPHPFSFLLLPQVDSSGGHPADVDNS